MTNRADQNLNSSVKSLNEEFQVLIALVCESIGLFKLYDPKRLAVSVSRSRSSSKNGVWAYVASLRHPGGAEFRRGKRRGIAGSYRLLSPRISKQHPEARYLMTFLVPRFFYLSSFERLETIVHELYHLHPELKGDLRTFPGKHRHHGPTPHAYNRRVRELTTEALSTSPWLKMHPLLAADAEYFKHRRDHHLPIPKQVFVPDFAAESFLARIGRWMAEQGSALALFIFYFLLSAVLIGSTLSAQAAVSTQKGALLSGPASSADQVGVIAVGEGLQVLKSSASGRWILVKTKDGKEGWVPAKWLSGLPQKINQSSGEEDKSRPSPSSKQSKVPKTTEAPDTKAASLSADAELGSSDPDLNDDSAVVGEGSREAPAGSAEFSEALRTQIKATDELEKTDRKLDKFIAIKKGKFFETPSKFAVRYGLIEEGDTFEILERSKKGNWLKVRLLLTGEEGWYPQKWMKVQREERMGRWNATTLAFGLGYGTGGAKIGLGVDYLFNLQPEGFVGSPRDRLELGFFSNFFLGESLTSNGVSISARYLRLGPLIRYVGVTANGFLGGSIEGGLQMTRSFVSYAGTSEDVLIDSGVQPSSFYYGAIMGFTGFVAQTPRLQYSAGVRIFLGTPSSVYIFAGPSYRF